MKGYKLQSKLREYPSLELYRLLEEAEEATSGFPFPNTGNEATQTAAAVHMEINEEIKRRFNEGILIEEYDRVWEVQEDGVLLELFYPKK